MDVKTTAKFYSVDGDEKKPVLAQIHLKSMVDELGFYASEICLALHISKH